MTKFTSSVKLELSNGGWPVASSYKTTPSAHKSD